MKYIKKIVEKFLIRTYYVIEIRNQYHFNSFYLNRTLQGANL